MSDCSTGGILHSVTSDNPIVRGTGLAIAAAVLFGVTTPLVKHFGVAVGPFATAALLYAGAALGSGLPRRRTDEPTLGRGQMGRLVLVAVFGAALAPAALAWGLQHAGALAAALLLNLEAIFTILLARAFYGEPVGRRVATAASLMLAGGAVLALRAGTTGTSSALGLIAISCATLGWALDNTATRPLADFDPRAVVFWKAALGVTLSSLLATLVHDSWPRPAASLALLACGGAGYGFSLRLYLRAQRLLGAARTGSLFAAAPFVGALLAFSLGDRAEAQFIALSAALFGLAVYLHVTESHAHGHVHEPLEHEHAHRHDDGHHLHIHEPPVYGVHSHAHRHEPMQHEHAHGSDLHHRHEHD
ncbi:MAG TPA: EamA family transporter [Polyangiaceae bacterium]|jgi:drug/metabolite transporter (DMT)-like permease